ncbi:MAG: hypothetical protein ACLTMP_04685 [Eggerthella lenta]
MSYGLVRRQHAAMLMTRGLAEMSRLVVRCGGRAITCMGLAGTGNLVATCTSEHCNRRFGKLLADGTLEEFAAQTCRGASQKAQDPADCYDVGFPSPTSCAASPGRAPTTDVAKTHQPSAHHRVHGL